MNFIVSSNALLKRLTAIGSVIVSNPVVPILENFLFELNNDTLTIFATDTQTTMIAELPIEAKCKGKIAIPAKMLVDTLKSLPEQPVTFNIDKKTNRITIGCKSGEYELAGESGEFFPLPPKSEKPHSVEIESCILLRALTTTIISINKNDTWPAQQGICVSMTDSKLEFAATNNFTMSIFKLKEMVCDYAEKIIIPSKSIHILKSSLPDNDTIVKLEFNSSNAFFTYDNIKMICRLIDERFPDYENAIPTNNPNKLTISRTDFLNSLKRISIYANKTTHLIRIKVDSNSIVKLSAEDLDFESKASESISCEYEGSDLEIGFGCQQLIEILRTLEGENVDISFSLPHTPALITPKDGLDSILMAIGPIMI